MQSTSFTRTRAGVSTVHVMAGAPRTRLARLGDWMARNRSRIAVFAITGRPSTSTGSNAQVRTCFSTTRCNAGASSLVTS